MNFSYFFQLKKKYLPEIYLNLCVPVLYASAALKPQAVLSASVNLVD